MIKYTDYPRTTEQELLALDSIYRILTLQQRILLHHGVENLRTNKYLNWIEETAWKSPFMKYPEFDKDTLYYELKNGELLPIEYYALKNPEITKQILKLK